MVKAYRAFVLLLAALLAACSVSRLAYLNAPPLATWYLSGYVNLSGEQKALVKERLARAMAWHRDAELPQYQRAIEGLIGKMNVKVSVDDARSTYTLARDYYHRSLEHLLPDIADFLLMIDASQIGHIEKKLADDDRKLVKESVQGTPEDRRLKRAKKYVDQFEEWTGKLSEPQRELVINGTRTLPELTDERMGDRKYRQAEILQLIRTKPPRDQVVAKLRTLLIDTDSWRRPDYVAKLRERDERILQVVSQLSSTLTPEQRASVQKKMRGYVKDISSIMAAGQDGRG
jgi:hypothetical protein